MKTFRKVFTSSIFLITITATAQLPQKTRELLRSLPDQKLTLPLILSYAIDRTDQYKILSTQKLSAQQVLLQSTAILDPELKLELTRLDDRSAKSSSFNAEKVENLSAKLELKQYFQTGTSIGAGYQFSNTSITYPQALQNSGFPLGETDYKEGIFSLSLRQNLWQDSFGYATRQSIAGALSLAKSIQLLTQDQIEDYLLSIKDKYYDSWLAQAYVFAKQDRVRWQQRLLNITKMQVRRGTAETPDLLQIESALLVSQEELNQAKQQLQDIWHQLIISMKLPSFLLQANPAEIPLAIEDTFKPASRLCSDNNPDEKLKTNPAFQSAMTKLSSAELQLNAKDNRLAPKTELFMSLSQNEIGNDNSSIWRDSLGGQHPSLLVGASLSFPLGNQAAQADFTAALKEKLSSQYQRDQTLDQLRVQWKNDCDNLKRLIQAEQSLNRSLKIQQKRNELEENRFRLGRITAYNVVQAGEDLTQAQLALRTTEAELRKAAWNILKSAGQMQQHLTTLIKPLKLEN